MTFETLVGELVASVGPALDIQLLPSPPRHYNLWQLVGEPVASVDPACDIPFHASPPHHYNLWAFKSQSLSPPVCDGGVNV